MSSYNLNSQSLLKDGDSAHDQPATEAHSEHGEPHPQPIAQPTDEELGVRSVLPGRDFNAKQLALTYPQCTATKNELAVLFDKNFSSIKSYVIAREQHADGNYHLHAYLELTSPYHSRGSHKRLELYSESMDKSHYPNVQGVRNKARWLKYISKEDTDLLAYNINVPQWLE